MKIFLSRTLKGIKKGLITPTFSPKLLEFQRKPLIRLLRVIGGLSFLTLLGRGYYLVVSQSKVGIENTYITLGLFYLSFLFATLFFIYHIYITYHRIKHIKLVLKSGELDIRN
jgi:hypothetical protein